MRLPDSPNLPPDMPRLIRQLTTLWRQLSDWTRTLGVDDLADGNVPTWDATLGQFVAGTGGGGGSSTSGGILIQGGSTDLASALAVGFAVDAIVPAGYALTGGWDLTVQPSGSLTLDIRKSTFPTFPPVASIVATAPPTITAAITASSSTLTGWTTAIAREDVLRAYVTANTGVKWFSLLLKATKT